MFIIRHGKPRRSRRRSNWRSLPLHLSLSSLSDDADIARLLSIEASPTPTIQHRLFTPASMDILPQSLPPSILGSNIFDNTISISSPRHLLDHNAGDWTFVHTPHHTDPSPTPFSEPETWILIDDL